MNNQFTAEDGHIERIEIDCDKVIIHFQTWNNRNFVLTYSDIDEMYLRNPVGTDIGEYRITELPDGKTNYSFYEAWDSERIVSVTAEIYSVQEKS